MNQENSKPPRCVHCQGLLKDEETGPYCTLCLRLPPEVRENDGIRGETAAQF